MMTLILGGSGSGKSGYAEDYVSEIFESSQRSHPYNPCRKYYLATMQAFDPESRKKIERHRRQRSGKGFQTIEQPVKIEEALEKMDQTDAEQKQIWRTEQRQEIGQKQQMQQAEQKSIQETEPGQEQEQIFKGISRTVLLECVSNLAANEMFAEDGVKDRRTVTEKILSGLQCLYESVEHLVIVSNNVFEDGNVYEETTMEYIRALGDINGKLAEMADQVIEVVVGIPLVIKEAPKRCNAME